MKSLGVGELANKNKEENKGTVTENEEGSEKVQDTATESEEGSKEVQDTATESEEGSKEVQDTATESEEEEVTDTDDDIDWGDWDYVPDESWDPYYCPQSQPCFCI